MNVLGIETSCDETSAAVVAGGKKVLSSVVFSQIPLHRPYGGVVPEIASRSHVENLPEVIRQAVEKSGAGWDGIDAIAFTYGPGLASSLLVGISAAKGLAFSLGKPLIAIDHIEAHIYSVFLGEDALLPSEISPFLCLVVSGGHTALVRVEGIGRYKLLGRTADDAAGEAFDKGANLLGLGYPGGPVIDKIAKDGDPSMISFPRGRQKKERNDMPDCDPNLCFSFSGLKTALLYYLKKHPLSKSKSELPSIAASYQEAIVEALTDRAMKALTDERYVACVGGVSLNSRLRQKMKEAVELNGVSLLLAQPAYCADNAAMVAGLAGAGGGLVGSHAFDIDADPSLELCSEKQFAGIIE